MRETRVIINVIILNILLSVAKLTIGFLTFSQALIMEGLDSFMDSINSIIALFAVIFSHKKEDEGHPYGHGRIEYIASFLLSIIIMYSSVLFIQKIYNHELIVDSTPSKLALIVLATNLLVKLFVSLYLLKKGKKHSNTLISTLGFENLSDIPKTIIAILGITMVMMDISTDADMYAGILIGILILISGIKIFLEAFNHLLGQVASDDIYDNVRQLAKVDDVIEVNKLTILKKGPYYLVIIDIAVSSNISVGEGHEIALKVSKSIKSINSMRYVTVHVDPV